MTKRMGPSKIIVQKKGITVLKRQTFLKNFGYHFERRRLGPRGNQVYYFMGCRIEPYEKNDEQGEVEVPDHGTLIEMFYGVKGSNQVGYASNDKNPLKNTGFESNSNGIQLASNTNRVRNERENENIEYNNNKKYIAHKLDTGEDDRNPPENQGLVDNKSVSNLNEPPLPPKQPELNQNLNPKPDMAEEFNKILNEIKSRNIKINESLSEIDYDENRFLVYTLVPYRPDVAMRELGFRYVNMSKDGVLYERPFNTQALQGGGGNGKN